MDWRRQQAQELRRQIEWTLARAVDPGDVLPMLHRLARLAAEGSDECLFAHLHLAELLVERDPWRAALYARRVLAQRPDDDRGWATLALCQTLLGNYKFAVSAYHNALTSAPKNPWYAHNLGHLLDVALGRAEEAVGWLRRAYQSAAYSGEVAASYAHALARVGRIAEARKILTRAMKRTASREHAALLKWVEQGAPPDKDHPLPRPAPVHALVAGDGEDGDGTSSPVSRERGDLSEVAPPRRTRDDREEQAPRRTRTSDGSRAAGGAGAGGAPPNHGNGLLGELEAVLARGLASLPLDAKQRARAKALARDALTYFIRPTGGGGAPPGNRIVGARGGSAVHAVAAAVAYAIVYVDHIPLTQAEVAACFRVSVASLRGRFGELRSHLDLLPGDARYATLRRR
jgi:tetratricopeptide (TPR) repeat protein